MKQMIDTQSGEVIEGFVRPVMLARDVAPATSIPFLRSANNYDMSYASQQNGLDCTVEPSLTQQQFKDECDINTIVERFGLTGELPEIVNMPVSGDFSEAITDYQSALNMVIAAQDAFNQLPAGVRQRFQNNPQVFMEFMEKEENRDEARKMGLLKDPVPAPMPVKVEVVPPPEPAK